MPTPHAKAPGSHPTRRPSTSYSSRCLLDAVRRGDVEVVVLPRVEAVVKRDWGREAGEGHLGEVPDPVAEGSVALDQVVEGAELLRR